MSTEISQEIKVGDFKYVAMIAPRAVNDNVHHLLFVITDAPPLVGVSIFDSKSKTTEFTLGRGFNFASVLVKSEDELKSELDEFEKALTRFQKTLNSQVKSGLNFKPANPTPPNTGE